MVKLRKVFTTVFTLMIALMMTNMSYAQCVKFNDSPDGDAALKAHSVYRTYMSAIEQIDDLAKLKPEDFKITFDNWKAAYDAAPAADGARPTHWRDGRKLYGFMLKNETDKTKQQEYYDIILRLYDEEQACYETKGLPSYALGRKAFDMFYGIGADDAKMRSSYEATLETLGKAVEVGGNDTEYVIFDPYARIVLYQFTNDLMDKETARNIHIKLNEIADHNIKNSETQKKQFESAKASMNAVMAPIEQSIFDCDYFVKKIQPQYKGKENDNEFLLESITILRQQGCEPETSPFLAEIEAKYKVYADAENARRQAEYEANNPSILANKLYKEGDYKGAISKYEEAIAAETDDSKKASFYNSIASIQFRKLKNKSAARSNALKAANLRPGWGKPYLMIGDMYASSTRSCGKAPWQQRMVVLAAVDKYAYARSIDSDPEVQAEANKKIGKYAGEKPEKGDVFMAGYKEGGTYKIGCWIGENVKIRVN